MTRSSLRDSGPWATIFTARAARCRHADQDARMSSFDLSPPTEAQHRALAATLTDAERRVLLEHGTEAAFCGVFLDNKQDGVYTCRCAACRCSAPAPSSIPAPAGRVSSHLRSGACARGARHQLRHDPRRDRLRALRQPPGPCLSRWPAAHRRTPLPRIRCRWASAPTALDCRTCAARRAGGRAGRLSRTVRMRRSPARTSIPNAGATTRIASSSRLSVIQPACASPAVFQVHNV